MCVLRQQPIYTHDFLGWLQLMNHVLYMVCNLFLQAACLLRFVQTVVAAAAPPAL
jgi:hypothetical protein